MLESNDMANGLRITRDGRDVAYVAVDHNQLVFVPGSQVTEDVRAKAYSVFDGMIPVEGISPIDNLAASYEKNGFTVSSDDQPVETSMVSEAKEISPEQIREAKFIYNSNLIEDVTEVSYEEILHSLVKNNFGGHVSAWRYVKALAKDKTPLTLDHVKQVQKFITDEQSKFARHFLDPKYRGHLRDCLVRIGRRIVGVPDELNCKAFFVKLNNDMSALDPRDIQGILRFAARVHLQYEQSEGMHPFADGNGRSGRVIVNYILAYFGYSPLVLKNEDKENYYHAFDLEKTDGSKPMEDYFVSRYEMD